MKTNNAVLGPVQGQDTTTINAPLEQVWAVITDSAQMQAWGPPVTNVDVELASGATEETVGSRRFVDIAVGKRTGRLVERRIEHQPHQTLAYAIESDEFMGSMLKDSGFSMALVPLSSDQTEFTFTFYQRAKGVKGKLMNPMVRIMQRRGRRQAMASLKAYIERADDEH